MRLRKKIEDKFGGSNVKNNDYNFRVILLCWLKNVISLICFTILAVVFKHWWIVFFSLLFYSYVEKEK